jgi:muramoyltetrapeptide carboxypeptidase LdcA involved in peptidoglycan recycling
MKAGLTSFYGTSVLVGFAENGGMHPYQINDIKNTLFNPTPIGEIKPNIDGWTSERIEWKNPELAHIKRKLEPNPEWNFLQGKTIVRGKLIGGCAEVLEFLKGTDYWCPLDFFEDAILFLETSEDMPSPDLLRWWLRNYALVGILHRLQGLILGRPYHNQYVTEYNNELLKVLREEGLNDLPVITEMDFGHTCPTFTIPYGVMAEIDPINKKFSILESGVESHSY